MTNTWQTLDYCYSKRSCPSSYPSPGGHASIRSQWSICTSICNQSRRCFVLSIVRLRRSRRICFKGLSSFTRLNTMVQSWEISLDCNSRTDIVCNWGQTLNAVNLGSKRLNMSGRDSSILREVIDGNERMRFLISGSSKAQDSRAKDCTAGSVSELKMSTLWSDNA